MATSKIAIGTKVQNGGVITKIITKSTGYVEVTYANGSVKKAMAFNLNDENGVSLKAKPKTSTKEVKPMTKEESEKFEASRTMVFLQGQIADGKAKGFMNDVLFSAKEMANDMIVSICNYANTRQQLSDKQAYCVSIFAAKNNIDFNVNAN